MAIKLKCKQTLMKIGNHAGQGDCMGDCNNCVLPNRCGRWYHMVGWQSLTDNDLLAVPDADTALAAGLHLTAGEVKAIGVYRDSFIIQILDTDLVADVQTFVDDEEPVAAAHADASFAISQGDWGACGCQAEALRGGCLRCHAAHWCSCSRDGQVFLGSDAVDVGLSILLNDLPAVVGFIVIHISIKSNGADTIVHGIVDDVSSRRHTLQQICIGITDFGRGVGILLDGIAVLPIFRQVS